MKIPQPVVIDCETLPIEDRPRYPPPAVGVSFRFPGKSAKTEYMAFGHPVGNTASWGQVRDAIQRAYANPDGVLFQNGKFDLDVIEEEFGIAPPAWNKVHDTMLLLFLDDPHQKELGLKPSAERLLGLPPGERDVVVDYLLARQPLSAVGTRLTAGKAGDRYAGAYVAFAPVKIAGPYANGDVDRTCKLFKLLYPSIKSRRMMEAYDRERKLIPLLLEMERQGIAVDLPQLRHDVPMYTKVAAEVDAWIIKRLKAPADINLNSGQQLVKAMLAAGVADEEMLGVTESGATASNKAALMSAVTDDKLLGMLRYRASLKTCLGTFMEPWLCMAEATGGLIHTTWNQVKAEKEGSSAGTRTGRLSATWFMNMPKGFTPLWRHQEPDAAAAKRMPACPVKGLPDLPFCRGYITPFAGEVFADRDYSQQEPRILAHFDGGELMRKYNDQPRIDFHDFAKAELEKVGLFYARKPVKNTNLGLIYGMGNGTLAERNNMTVEEAKTLKAAILRLYPGLKAIYEDMRHRAAANEPIHTWGGREYYCEPPKLVKGTWRKFDYKMVNILIQGSAADCTKEAIIRLFLAVDQAGKRGTWRPVLNVHDQLTVSCPRRDLRACMETLRVCMEGIEFDVPMLTDGEWSDTNWAKLQPYDKKGEVCYAGK